MLPEGGVARPPALQDFVILFPLLGRRGAEQDAEGGGHLPWRGADGAGVSAERHEAALLYQKCVHVCVRECSRAVAQDRATRDYETVLTSVGSTCVVCKSRTSKVLLCLEMC